MQSRWGQNWGRGITYRPDHSPSKPYHVKFFRNDKWYWLGSFRRLYQAQACSAAFLLANPPHKKRPPAITKGQPNGTL